MNKYYEISEENARRAKESYSFFDYADGSKTAEYRSKVDYCYEVAEKVKPNISEDKHGYIDYLCDKYAKQLAEYYNKSFSISLMCPSVMIAGGSNFPVRKKEKQNIADNKNMQFYTQVESIIEKIKETQYQSSVIKSGDPIAVEKLQDKLTELENLQVEMKAQNAYYHKNRTMVGYDDWEDEKAAKVDEVIKAGYSWEQQPYPSYELTNNNAKIKNTKSRLEQLQKVKSQDNEIIEKDGYKVVRNTELMRVQFLFDNKPNAEIRELLKSSGFKWSPNNNAWQRQLTNNAIDATRKIMKVLADV